MHQSAARRLTYRKVLEFLTNVFDYEVLETDDRGTPLSPEARGELLAVFERLLLSMQAAGRETAPCGYLGCKMQVHADDFLCTPHWHLVPEELRASYKEEHMKGKDGDKAFLRTALAYIHLAVDRRNKNKR